MKFISTRDTAKQSLYDSAEVIKLGLAPDGGLFVPESIPALSEDDMKDMMKMSYAQRAAHVLSFYLTDYSKEELLADCEAAYGTVSFPESATVVKKVNERLSVLELWHGPTAAFKDMALQIMPRLLSRALRKTNEKRDALVLVATSGDTGKAALEGYKDVPHIKIEVFYPVDGVSKMQKLQMATQEGGNVEVCAVKGNFDDAQNGVKQLFASEEMKKEIAGYGYVFSSANSINWGRLAPQIAYYVSAYLDMVAAGTVSMGETIDVCVPTGNFGNILAAFIAKKMGLPIAKLVCASNRNNVLTDFLNTGVYDRNRTFYTTSSPSMDILISSNLERLLWFAAGPEKTANYMDSLKKNGKYVANENEMQYIRSLFCGYCADENKTYEAIKKYKAQYGYTVDPHTAVALSCADEFMAGANDQRPMLAVSTASPYKFANSVISALGGIPAEDGFEACSQLSEMSGMPIHRAIDELRAKKVRFTKVIEPAQMSAAVLDWLNQKN